MQRKELLATLQTVAPALASNDIIQSLSHFWFRGKSVMAFNDQISISTPLATDFVGAVPGSLILKLLNATGSEKIEFLTVDDKDNSEIILKAGAAKIRLPVMTGAEAFIFDFPKSKDGVTITPTDKLISAFETCMMSVSSDTSVPDQLGITVITDGNKIDLYSTNNVSLNYCPIRVKDTLPKLRMILPTLFCSQFLALAKNSEKVTLTLCPDHVVMDADGTKLFGKFVETPNPLDFVSIIKQHTVDPKKQLIEIPAKLGPTLDRIIIMTESQSKVDQSPVRITVADGKMSFFAKSEKGEVKDYVVVKGDLQKDLQIRVDPRPFKKGVEKMREFLATDDCLILRNDVGVYLISITQ